MPDPKIKEPKNKTALALLAHPDDAEFICAGTLALLAERGWTIHIATAANGDCGTMTETRWAIAGIRTAEATRAAAMLDGTYHCLGCDDGFVMYDRQTLQAAYDLFRRVNPSLVFIHAAKDYMLDHDIASMVGRAASFLFGAPNASAFPLPKETMVPYLYYCDPHGGCEPVSGQIVTPTTYVDISTTLEKKAEMLACHASQREWLRTYHGTDEYLDAMRRQSAFRGEQISVSAAEAFVQHRGHPYPTDDLLGNLFS